MQSCVVIVQDLLTYKTTGKEANELLGTSESININGYSVDEYISDIKQRVELIK